MSMSVEDRRSKWKAMMKEALHQAVVKVLAEDGLSGLTMDRITQMAGMSKGTLYNYFKDKQELLEYVVQSSLEPLEQGIDRILDSDLPPEQKLEQVVLHSMNYFEEHRDFFRIFQDPDLHQPKPKLDKERKSRHRKLVQRVSVVFEEGIRSGVFRPFPPLKLAAMFVMSVIAMNMGRIWTEERGPIEEEARMVTEVFFRGITVGGKKS
jgi:AcrR family transcriptional regulator